MIDDEILLCYGEFVNRDTELKRFCSILDENEYIGMVINGESGIGKSWLQKRMIYECREVRKMRWAKTFYLATHTYNYMAILRMLRDDIGLEHFARFTDLLNYFTKPDYSLSFNFQNPGDVKILEGAELEGNEIKEITGQKVVIQDLNINTPREDKEIREQERMFKLTQQFLTDLAAALNGDNVAILIDDVEEMPEETKQWLWEDFINGVLKKELTNIRFVLCSDDKPELKNEFLRRKVRVGALKPLDEEHIIQYLEKRKIGDEGSRKIVASMIMANVQGNPKKMADFVTTFVEHQRNKEDD